MVLTNKLSTTTEGGIRYIDMKKLIIILTIFILTSLSVASVMTNHPLTTKPIPAQAMLVLDAVIKPFLASEFSRDIEDEEVLIKRNLTFVDIYRYEYIELQHLYSVHVEWASVIKSKPDNFAQATGRGQEIVFWIEDMRIVDYYPFDEYIIYAGEVYMDI